MPPVKHYPITCLDQALDQARNAWNYCCPVSKTAIHRLKALGAILAAAGIGCIVAGLKAPAIALLVMSAAALILGFALGRSKEENADLQQVDWPEEPLNIEARKNIQVVIPPEVRPMFDQLFEGSPYAVDTLPIYPILLKEGCSNTDYVRIPLGIVRRDALRRHPQILQVGPKSPTREGMTEAVMKGTTDGHRPFIIIKVDCTLRDEDIEKIVGDSRNYYRTHRHLEDILVLYQYNPNDPDPWGRAADAFGDYDQNFIGWEDGTFIWGQLGVYKRMPPLFFSCQVEYLGDDLNLIGLHRADLHSQDLERVQTLLKTGQSEDTRGLLWRIPTT